MAQIFLRLNSITVSVNGHRFERHEWLPGWHFYKINASVSAAQRATDIEAGKLVSRCQKNLHVNGREAYIFEPPVSQAVSRWPC